MDERSIKDAPARPFGGVPLSRHIGLLPAIPRSAGFARPGVVAGGRLPTDDDLVERTLAFSGSYVSDDGHLAIRRSAASREYSAHAFLGYCRTCARARLIVPTGEPLPDLAAAIRFTATHDHDEVD
jgi:hypothetical protein